MSDETPIEQPLTPAPQEPIVRWKITEYEILSFELTDKFVAVFADKADDGLTDLFEEPIQAIGLAKVTTKFAEGVRGKGVSRYVDEPDVINELIGMQLEYGYWHIVNDVSNFSGVMKVGGDIAAATGCLNRNEFKTLRCAEST